MTGNNLKKNLTKKFLISEEDSPQKNDKFRQRLARIINSNHQSLNRTAVLPSRILSLLFAKIFRTEALSLIIHRCSTAPPPLYV